MAAANQQPVLNVHAGAAALDEDLVRVMQLLGASSLEDLGWVRPNSLTLLIPMVGISESKQQDKYLLRLGFQAYRAWPPSAQFVNPSTQAFQYPQDQPFVPQIVSPECYTHVAYRNGPQSQPIQLVCCSATLEFYTVLHAVNPDHLWNEKNTFYTTITAIQKGLGGSYKGRFPAHGQ
jgi:hypothetical protein